MLPTAWLYHAPECRLVVGTLRAPVDCRAERGASVISSFRFSKHPAGGTVAEYYTVKQGDHVAGIAFRFGLSDFRTIWDHPNNTELKNKRQNPNVLFPGDVLYVPDRE